MARNEVINVPENLGLLNYTIYIIYMNCVSIT